MSRRVAELAIVVLVLFAGALVFTWPLAADPSFTLPAPGDSLYNAWVLGWIADRVAYGLSGVWDTPIFHPYRNTLALAEPMFGLAVPLAPAAWLGANALLLHNLGVWASFVVAGTGGYLLGRALTGSRAGGVVCAAFAAFAPYRIAHLPHVQVLMVGWLWWVMWAVHRYFAAPRLGTAVAAALFYILLGLSSLYWAYIAIVPIVAVALVAAWRTRGPVRAWLGHGLVAAALCVAAFLPVARPLRALTTSDSPVSGTVDRRSYSADALGFVSVPPTSLMWGSLLRGGDGEGTLFPGVTVMACALLGLVALRDRRGAEGSAPLPSRRWVVVYLGLLIAGIVLSLGPTPAWNGRPLGQNPVFGWLSVVPGVAQLRASARFAVIAQLALSVLAAHGLATWLARRRAGAREAALTGAAVAAAIFLEGLALPVSVFAFSSFPQSGDRRAAYWLAQRPGGAVLELPLDGWGPIDYSMVYQHRTLAHGHPMVAGVSRFNPPLPAMLADPDSPLVDPDRAPEAVAFLRALGVRYVVAHPGWFRSRSFGLATVDAYVAASGRAAAPFGESTVIDLGSSPEPEAAGSGVRAIDAAPLRVRATSGAVDRMLDGDVASRWLTGTPQRGGERIDIELPAVTPVAGVRLQLMGRSLNDYPRQLTVSTSADGVTFTATHAGSVFPAFGAALRRDPIAPAIDLRWPAAPARFVRLEQTGRTSRRWFWSIHELRVLVPAS